MHLPLVLGMSWWQRSTHWKRTIAMQIVRCYFHLISSHLMPQPMHHCGRPKLDRVLMRVTRKLPWRRHVCSLSFLSLTLYVRHGNWYHSELLDIIIILDCARVSVCIPISDPIFPRSFMKKLVWAFQLRIPSIYLILNNLIIRQPCRRAHVPSVHSLYA